MKSPDPIEKYDREDEKQDHRRPLGCRRIACGGCFSIVILFIVLIFLIISKPDFFWNPMVDFLNNGREIEMQEEHSIEDAKAYIENQVTGFGENVIVIPEEYITPLLKEVLVTFNRPYAQVDEQGMHIYWIMDNKIEDNPLLGKVTVKVDEKLSIYASSIGFERFGIPEFFAKAITNAVESALQLVDSQSGAEGLLQRLFGTSNEFEIKKIEFKKDELRLLIDVKFSLFN